MLLGAHAGITLGLAVLLARLAASRNPVPGVVSVQGPHDPGPCTCPGSRGSAGLSWLGALARYADVRIVLVGSLLPDLIDKPLGQVLLAGTVNNGRIYAHTGLFLVVMTLAGIHLFRSRKRTWLLALSFGTLVHLVLDFMWLSPGTLVWPLYGLSFDRMEMDLGRWLRMLVYAALADPVVTIPEIIGWALLGWFAGTLVREKKLVAFIRRGEVG